MDWKQLLAYITGSVDEELLLRDEYLVTENRFLRSQIKGRVRLSDGERKTLAEIGMKLGKQALEEVASIVQPDTILAWHGTLVAQKCDGTRKRQVPGRPTTDAELEALVVMSGTAGQAPQVRPSLGRMTSFAPRSEGDVPFMGGKERVEWLGRSHKSTTRCSMPHGVCLLPSNCA
jgi:hypothetical protein